MDKKILFSATPTEKRAALLEAGKIVELVVERPDQLRIVGNIYRGKVQTILPGIQSAFIEIGMEKAAFLHCSDVDPTLLMDASDPDLDAESVAHRKRKRLPQVPIEKVLSPGQEILVQVIKEPIGTKGPKVTTQLSIAGRFLVLVPDTDFISVSKRTTNNKKRDKLKQIIKQLKPPGVGFIVRTIGLSVSETEFIGEIHSLIDTWNQIHSSALEGLGPKLVHKEHGITTLVIREMLTEDVSEVWVDQRDDFNEIKNYTHLVAPGLKERVFLYDKPKPLFDAYDVEKELEKSLRRKVWLKSGGHLTFDHAEALLAIDVNTGRNTGGKNLEETILNTNIEAVDEITRQLRLRDIGGIIVVDFIDMSIPENIRTIETRLHELLKKESTSTSCTRMSKFGLIQITRKRVRPELQELYTDACPTCHGLGWVLSPSAVAAKINRYLHRSTGKNQGRFLLRVNPTVAEFLEKENSHLVRKIEKEHSVHLSIISDDEIDQDEYQITPDNSYSDRS